MNKQLPEDIQIEWLSVVRRLQSVAKSQGLSVISINILVDSEGKPIQWTAPKQTIIEPKSGVDNMILLLTSMVN